MAHVPRDNSRGRSGATNGPYTWGNGPKPKGKSSSSAVAPVIGIAWAFIAVPVLSVVGSIAYILHGNGVI